MTTQNLDLSMGYHDFWVAIKGNATSKVETKEELVSMVERLRRSPIATERVDWRRLDSRDLIQ